VIRLAAEGLSGRQRYALALLADLACLPTVHDPEAEVVGLAAFGHAAAIPAGLASLAGDLDLLRVDPAGGKVLVAASALEAVARVVLAEAEANSSATDRHGRVPSEENEPVRAGVDRLPVISSLARRLRQAVVAAAGSRRVRFVSPWPWGHRWAAAVTHDVDVLDWWPVFSAARVLELVRKGEIARAVRVLAAATADRHPVRGALRRILEIEREHSVISTWFFLHRRSTVAGFFRGDVSYQPEGSRSRDALASVGAGGHEIALHGSFATGSNSSDFTAEREALQQAIGGAVRGIRQHFLRMRPGHTQEYMSVAGFGYDASFGYPDRNGFRLGVADVVSARHTTDSAGPTLDLVPLVWMDRAQSKYQGIEDPQRWTEEALVLAERCRSVEGIWVGLWHPNLATALGFPDAVAAFERLVSGLAQEKPWFASVGDIVEWRRLRRSVRIDRASGSEPLIASFSNPVGSDHAPRLESIDGLELERAVVRNV